MEISLKEMILNGQTKREEKGKRTTKGKAILDG